MKKIILSIVLAFVAFASNAQFHVGGTVGLSVQSIIAEGDNQSVASIAIAPELSYKFNHKWAAGLNLGLSASSTTNMTTLTCAPYLRYTFAEVGPVNFFAEVAAGYECVSYEGHSLGGVGVALRPGLTVDLNEKIHLVGRTSLLRWSTVSDEITVTQIGLAINPSLEFGVMFRL